MIRYAWATALLLPAGLTVCADEAPRVAVVKKLSQELGDATIKGDYAKVIDGTYEPLVEKMGGRKKAIEFTETTMKLIKAKGLSFKAFHIGEPGEFLTKGSNTFVVIPTTTEMTFGGGKIVAKSYLLGISPDDGKTWKFVEGAGIEKHNDIRDKLLPKLPEKLKLPEVEKPMIVKDE